MLPYWITCRPPKRKKPHRPIDLDLDYDLKSGIHEGPRHTVFPEEIYEIYDKDGRLGASSGDGSIPGDHALIMDAYELNFEDNEEYLGALQAYIDLMKRLGKPTNLLPNNTQLLGEGRILYPRPKITEKEALKAHMAFIDQFYKKTKE